MVKSTKDKLEIYSMPNKKKFQIGILLTIIAIIWCIFYMFLFKPEKALFKFALLELVIGVLFLISIIIIYRKLSFNPKLELVLTKNELIIYKYKKAIQINREDIKSFLYNNSTYIDHTIFIEYFNKNKKKSFLTHYLKGMNEAFFVDQIANKWLEKEGDFDFSIITERFNNQKSYIGESENEIISKVVYLVGKNKLLVKVNNFYTVQNVFNVFYFVDKDGNEISVGNFQAVFEKNLDIKVGNFYTIKYDKLKDIYKIGYSNFTFDYKVVEDYKKRIDSDNELIIDDGIITKELECEDFFNKIKSYFKWGTLIILFILTICYFLKIISASSYINSFFIIILIDFPLIAIMFIYITHKIKKIEKNL